MGDIEKVLCDDQLVSKEIKGEARAKGGAFMFYLAFFAWGILYLLAEATNKLVKIIFTVDKSVQTATTLS